MTKEIIEAQIVDHARIARDIFRLTLHCRAFAGTGGPGQFVNLYLNDRSMLLPRPISICRMEAERLSLVYRVVGKGTKELSGYKGGDSLWVSTPLGQGYYVDRLFQTLEESGPGEKIVALVAGGLGVPPMVELAKAIQRRIDGAGESGTEAPVITNANGTESSGALPENGRRIRLIAALGFQDETFLTDELKPFCDDVLIATESGASGYRGNVLAMLEKNGITADYYLSCGTKPMLKALAKVCAMQNRPLQVSLEERMGCGYGACVGCTCRTRASENGIEAVKQKKVCKDGPVFFGEEVIWDE